MNTKPDIIFQLGGTSITTTGDIHLKTGQDAASIISGKEVGLAEATNLKELMERVTINITGDKLDTKKLPYLGDVLPEGFRRKFRSNHSSNCKFCINDRGEGKTYNFNTKKWVDITGCDVMSLEPVTGKGGYVDIDFCADKNGVIVNFLGEVMPDVRVETLQTFGDFYARDTASGAVLCRERSVAGIKTSLTGDDKRIVIGGQEDSYWHLASDPTKIVYVDTVIHMDKNNAVLQRINPFPSWMRKGPEYNYLIDKSTGTTFFHGKEIPDFDGRNMVRIAETKHFIASSKLLFSSEPIQVIPLVGEGAADFQDIGHGFFRNATNTVLFRGDHIITNIDVPSFTPLGDKTGYDLHGRVLLGPNSFLQIDSLSSLFQYPFFRNMFLDKDDNTLATTVLQLVALKKLVPSFTFCPKGKTTTTEV